MDLKSEVRKVMQRSTKALTVDQVAAGAAESLQQGIRTILNELVKDEELTSVHGGGGYQTHYHAPPFRRRERSGFATVNG